MRKDIDSSWLIKPAEATTTPRNITTPNCNARFVKHMDLRRVASQHNESRSFYARLSSVSTGTTDKSDAILNTSMLFAKCIYAVYKYDCLKLLMHSPITVKRVFSFIPVMFFYKISACTLSCSRLCLYVFYSFGLPTMPSFISRVKKV